MNVLNCSTRSTNAANSTNKASVATAGNVAGQIPMQTIQEQSWTTATEIS